MARRLSLVTILGYVLVLALLALGALFVINRRSPGQPISLPAPPTPSPLRVHVTGAVIAPGVYEVPAGAIVLDAIAAAGGPLAEADQNALNLARLVRDGDQIVVPFKSSAVTTAAPPDNQATGGGVTASPFPAPLPTAAGPLNLNTATVEQLETLPGIGPSLAQRIVDYRAEHGPFATIEAVMDVPGIGEGKFEAIKDLITT